MEKDVLPWDVLLSFEEFDDYDEEFGPHTQQVVNCFETLDTVAWFELAGSDVPEGFEAEGISTWDDAIQPLMSGEPYRDDGLLAEPADLVDEAREVNDYAGWLDDALEEVVEYCNYGHYVPGYLDKGEQRFLTDHLDTYVEYLLLEIIAADELDTTYFREALSWFEVGHFPCGWVGEWPDGKFRIF